MPRRTNGAGKPLLEAAIGSLHIDTTERLDLGKVWVDLLIPNPANQTFRARARKMKDEMDALKDLTAANIAGVIDADGQFTDDVIRLIHEIYIEDWGGYDAKGEPCPLYDANGDEVPCTFDNFRSVVCDMDGGGAFFMAIQQHIAVMNLDKTNRAVLEKNSFTTLPAQRASAVSRPTRKGRKQERASTR